jgi:DNA-binding transcriptional regulator YiaG
MTRIVNPEKQAVQLQRLTRLKGDRRRGWLTSTEMASKFGINPRTFRRWQQSGYVPSPAARTECGYGLWSPDQQRALLKKRTKS